MNQDTGMEKEQDYLLNTMETRMKLGMMGTLLPDAYLKDILLTEVMCNGCFQKISIHHVKEGFWKFHGRGECQQPKISKKV